jgi:hypothetical protein
MKNRIKCSSINLLFFGILIITFSSCKKLFPPEKLTIPLTPYTGNQLKIEGYFYSDSEPYKRTFILYRNGVILGGDNVLSSEIAIRETEFKNGVYYSYAKDDRLSWGRFIITDNSIKFENWAPRADFPVIQSQGEILNDTTFHISSSRHADDAYTPEDELYHFKKLSPKPDSTNSFTN